ncbi:DEAD/DEAH box helicase family protein [Planotetraspora sp. A-T 1434]|uniref:DEAD/DEAH box helicase family protein n=1 Tax=Planotetraspora sp. A-T 1434 TaxID=2979219 RepID=UPI0021C24DA3|nr:DEAD/DEAH box helicase family protein [Planotetraspora sp. A-T 1434]MCT9932028.1 DEAD/DEAH box helicase family protein [Planotetraspora sp. A-T 1434]
MSNFRFLDAEWPELYDEALRAERSVFADPRTSCFYARRSLELALTWLFDAESVLHLPYKKDLGGMLFEPTLRTLVGSGIHTKMDLIRRQGNTAVHKTMRVPPQAALATVRELFQVLFWVARQYSRDPEHLPADSLVFDETLIPRPVPAGVRLKTQRELKELSDKLARQDAALAEARKNNAALDAEIAGLRAQIAVAKAANQSRVDHHDYNEQETRDLFIDMLLKEAGWPLDQERDREFKVTGMPGGGDGYVDYVLWGDDGTPFGIVEAKRARKDPMAGQQQAKLYADRLQNMYGQRPIIFYTNGYETWLWDDAFYPPRPVQGFYTKDQLQLLRARRTSRKPLAEVPIDKTIVERHYQQRAICRIGETLEQDRQRKALIVMATGAGKTRMVIALADQLMRANWVKRVLFLADRKALVTQATNAFKTHLPSTTTINLLEEKSDEGRVYVSTYPTMMGLIDEMADGERRFGPGYFDLIVIDEAHRSVYQKYKAIFSYFDALLVGLTATPKGEVDRNTYRLFGLEEGVPTDVYNLDEAVREGFLVPPRAVSVPLKFQREGIRYDQLSEEEKDQWDSLEWEDGDIPDSVDSEAVSKWLFNIKTVDLALETLMRYGHKVVGGDRLGKTIIFAKNNDHAKFIAERFDANYPQYEGQFARVITYQTEYAQSLIDDFSTKDNAPHIAISVDMLDTGIDVPEVVNLMFFKVVRSSSKFWQMIGRGTRLCKNLYRPGLHKQDFLVFDLCQNFEFFNQNPETTEGSTVKSLSERLFAARAELVYQLDQRLGETAQPERDGTKSELGLRWDLAYELHKEVAGMRLENFLVRPQRRWVEEYADFKNWQRLTPEAANDLIGHVAGLPSSVRDDDEKAKEFDMLLLQLQLCLVNGEPGFDRLRHKVQDIASLLLEQTNIPKIRERQQVLDEVAGDEWWNDVTMPMLELVRLRVRELVKLIERSKQPPIYTDFEDEIGEVSEIQLRNVPSGTDRDRFQAKVRTYLKNYEDHVALQKLRRNKQLSPSDLSELERMLIENGVGTPADIAHASESAGGLGLFVRSLVGLDRAAAREPFSRFLEDKTLSANQLHFLDMMINHLAENGVMDPARLFEPPFSELAPRGPDVLFPGAQLGELITIISSVRTTAVSAEEVA